MGIIVMLFEAVAWRGLDNLFIPIASFALLKSYLHSDALDLSVRLAVILLLGLFLLFWRRRSTLDDSALIGAGLVAYGAWAVGDLYWLLVPVSVFVVATLLAQRMQADGRKPIHTVYALLSVAGPGLAWLVLNRNAGSADLFFAYTVAFTAHLTMFGVSHAHYGLETLSPPRIAPAILQGLGILLLPFLLMWGFDWRLIPVVLIGGLVLVLAGLLFLRLQPALADCPTTADRWIRQALIAGGLSLVAWFCVVVTGAGGLQG
jgi:phytol kinase